MMEPSASLPGTGTVACDIGPANGVLRVSVGPGLAQEVQECYRAFVNTCLQSSCTRALIVGNAKWDAFYHLALRDALHSMSVAGVPPGFRLALVAGVPELISIYDAALVEALRYGIDARRFAAETDAEAWLSS
jgi:hypothetical protein